ncbi:Gp138 family membrane-puncturing spike protein [Acinetobacter baumannii]
MAISLNERSPYLLNIIKDSVNAGLANIWNALPCEVESYDPDAVTISAQPLIKIPVKQSDGSIKLEQLPLLLDVPVMFPCAGGFTITHPINRGDECFISFASRNIDLWWQSGGIQNPFDTRIHDLSDGFAFFKPQSQAKKISNISTENLEIRSDDNATKIQITPGGIINFIGQKAVFKCPVEMEQTLTVAGIVKSLEDVIAKVISLFGHKHGGIKAGSDTSSTPQ